MKKFLSIILSLTMILSCMTTAVFADETTTETGATEASTAYELLNGKKVIFIGNSFIFRGLTVTPKYTLTQSSRTGDTGYFYQLCKANGIDVEVTNWTYSGHKLNGIFGGECIVSSCDGYGKKHEDYLTDKEFDYVIFSPGSGSTQDASFINDVEYIKNVFTEANPDAKFVCLGTATAYGWDSNGYAQTNITGYYETLKEMGIPVADWGKVVTDIIYGNYSVPGATQVYDKKSFIVSDGYHENMLTGYITSLMAYCAITGEKATGQPYSFYNDTTLNSAFDIPAYLDKYYTSSGADETNADEIMASPSDMNGIQQVVDLVLSGEDQAEIKENVLYAESFNNDTGAKITDLSAYGLVKVKSSGHEYVNTSGQFYVNNGEWKGFTSLVYNPSYTFTAKNYNIEVSGKNDLGNATQRMAVYLNYKDVKNYYAVRWGGAKRDNSTGTWTSTATVQIVKCANGETTVLEEAESTGIKQEFAISIEKKGNNISVYNGGDLVATATDDGTMVDGKYVAFGTESTRGYFDSISVSPKYENELYLEPFNNTSGERVYDISAWGITKAKDTKVEYVSSEGYLVVRDQTTGNTWVGKNSIMYNPSYEWTNNCYKATIKARNYMEKENQKMAVYLNFLDTNNYYAVTFGATTVTIVKRMGGTNTTLATFANTSIKANSGFTADIAMRDNLITVSNNGKIVAYAVDNGEMIPGTHFAFGTESTVGYFDSIQVTPLTEDEIPAKAYDGTTRIVSLDNMAGKTVTIKKNVDTEVTPLAVVKNSDGLLCAVAIGAVNENEATVEVTLPTDFAGGDLYLYQWSDMNTLVPLAETEKVNLD